jgi:hypothetical protein
MGRDHSAFFETPASELKRHESLRFCVILSEAKDLCSKIYPSSPLEIQDDCLRNHFS